MKNLYDYEKTQSATVDLPFGAFKNESSPGQQDGTAIVAEHIQDIAYCLFQVLQLAGVVPNSELEDGNNKTQFINALANIGILKHSDKVSYNASVFVWTINGSDFILYRSNKASNTDNLSNTASWTKILTIDNKNKINFHVDTNISSGSGSSMPVFCFNSGPVNNSGDAALITLSGNTLTLNSPAVGTTASGEVFKISENISLDISGLAAGNYNLFYNPDTQGLEIYNNTIYIQKAEPSNMQINDIWVDTSVMPYKSYKKISDIETKETKLTPNAVISIVSEEINLKNNQYNLNCNSEINYPKIGDPIPTLSNTLDANEIWLEGAVVSRTTYSKLFEIYGTTYGAGDGSTTFQLPNGIGRTFWGSQVFGYLNAGLPNIYGSIGHIGWEIGFSSASGPFSLQYGNTTAIARSSGSYTPHQITFNAQASNSLFGASPTVQTPSIQCRVKTRYK